MPPRRSACVVYLVDVWHILVKQTARRRETYQYFYRKIELELQNMLSARRNREKPSCAMSYLVLSLTDSDCSKYALFRRISCKIRVLCTLVSLVSCFLWSSLLCVLPALPHFMVQRN